MVSTSLSDFGLVGFVIRTDHLFERRLVISSSAIAEKAGCSVEPSPLASDVCLHSSSTPGGILSDVEPLVLVIPTV